MHYEINLEPPADTLAGRYLPRLIGLWLDHCAQRLPAATVTGYRTKINWFVLWWEDIGRWHDYQLSETLLADFGGYLNRAAAADGKPLAYNTRRDVLRRLRQFLHWAARRGYTPRDFAAWVPAADGSAPRRRDATVEHLVALLVAAGHSRTPIRDRAVVGLLAGTGIRLGECVALDISDILLDADASGTAMIQHAKRVKNRDVQGRLVAIDSFTGRLLVEHLDTCPAGGPLFVTESGRISNQTMYRVVKRAIERAGLVGVIQGPHDLRRAFVTYNARMLPGPAGAQYVSQQVGHTSFAMTQRYNLQDVESLRSVIRSPLAERVEPGKNVS